MIACVGRETYGSDSLLNDTWERRSDVAAWPLHGVFLIGRWQVSAERVSSGGHVLPELLGGGQPNPQTVPYGLH